MRGALHPRGAALGAQDEDNLRRYVANSAWIALAMSVVITIVTVLLARNILVWMQTPENILEDAYAYFVVILAGIPTTILYNLASSIMRALGDSRRPLYFLILSSALNVVLDLVFILNSSMGCAGAAWATILSQLVSGVLCVVYMVKKLPILRMDRAQWRPAPRTSRRCAAWASPWACRTPSRPSAP